MLCLQEPKSVSDPAAWYTHLNGQTIGVIEGVGRCQCRGGPIEVIHPDDRVVVEPGEEHWHGAAPDRFMTHLALVQIDDQGHSATWGEHVTDEEYGRRRRTGPRRDADDPVVDDRPAHPPDRGRTA